MKKPRNKTGARATLNRDGSSRDDAKVGGSGVSGERSSSSEWTKYVLMVCSTLGLAMTFHINFAVPSLRGDMKDIAEDVVGKRLGQWETLRREQITEIRKSIDRMADRMDRIDKSVSFELQSISMQLATLTQKIEGK